MYLPTIPFPSSFLSPHTSYSRSLFFSIRSSRALNIFSSSVFVFMLKSFLPIFLFGKTLSHTLLQSAMSSMSKTGSYSAEGSKMPLPSPSSDCSPEEPLISSKSTCSCVVGEEMTAVFSAAFAKEGELSFFMSRIMSRAAVRFSSALSDMRRSNIDIFSSSSMVMSMLITFCLMSERLSLNMSSRIP